MSNNNDENENKTESSSTSIPYLAGAFEVWALGISIVIGGQYFSWNFGLVAGFGSYLIATLLISVAYICLCFCTSELTSALPFAGGAYGLARCTLGYYPGFVVGCCETIEYIAYVSVSVYALGGMIVSMNPDAAINKHISLLSVFWFSILCFNFLLYSSIQCCTVHWLTPTLLCIPWCNVSV